jgi:hypothetical protein
MASLGELFLHGIGYLHAGLLRYLTRTVFIQESLVRHLLAVYLDRIFIDSMT